jgi:hypothetical protein
VPPPSSSSSLFALLPPPSLSLLSLSPLHIAPIVDIVVAIAIVDITSIRASLSDNTNTSAALGKACGLKNLNGRPWFKAKRCLNDEGCKELWLVK